MVCAVARFGWSSFREIVLHPVFVGITAGLVLGKLFGIAGFAWIAVKLGVISSV